MSIAGTKLGSKSVSKCTQDPFAHKNSLFILHERALFSHQQRSFVSFGWPRKRRRRTISQCTFSRKFAISYPLQEPARSASSASSTSRPTIPWPSHPNPSPYEIFNLPRTASQTEIKSQYFLLVKQYHPDHASRSSTDRFRRVVEAYKILSHPSKRLEYDSQNPASTVPRHSEFRQPWSGSRLSRHKTEQKGPPPSGGWSFRHPSARGRARSNMRPEDHYYSTPSDADNAHFSYEKHYRRNLEQEMKIKKRMDELHAHRLEFERQREQNKQSMRMGVAFTGGLFVIIVLVARALAPS